MTIKDLPRFTVHLNLSLRNQIKAAAAADGITMNDLATKLFEKYIEENKNG